MQDSFATSILPVFADVWWEVTKLCMITSVKFDNCNQFYSLNWRKKKKKLKVVGDENTTLSIIKTKMFFRMFSPKVGIETFCNILF